MSDWQFAAPGLPQLLIVAFLSSFLFWVSIFSMLCRALGFRLPCFGFEMLASASRVVPVFGVLPTYYPHGIIVIVIVSAVPSTSEILGAQAECEGPSQYHLPHLPCPSSSIYLPIFFYLCFLTSVFLGRRGHSHTSTLPSLSRTFVHPPVSAFHALGYFIRASSTCSLTHPCFPALIQISILV